MARRKSVGGHSAVGRHGSCAPRPHRADVMTARWATTCRAVPVASIPADRHEPSACLQVQRSGTGPTAREPRPIASLHMTSIVRLVLCQYIIVSNEK